MTPRLVTLLKAPPPGEPAGFVHQVPEGRRDRLTIAWPGAQVSPPVALIAAARDAGFTRVRLVARASGWTDASLRVAVEAGLNEAEVIRDAPGPVQALRSLREDGRLAYVALRSIAGVPGDVENPCGADAFVLEVDAAGPLPDDDRRLGGATSRFRRLAVRGWPLCAFPSLPEDRVISNALVGVVGEPGDGAAGRLRVPFEDPARVFTGACGACRLSFACDGIPARAFRTGAGEPLQVRPFGPGPGTELALRPSGLVARSHPATFLSGRVHVLGVEAGVRPCGRIVVDSRDAVRQEAALRDHGLRTRLLPAPAGPKDRDPGAGARGMALHHVFFSKGDQADRAADLQARFARSQDGDRPMDAAGFARDLGRLLGYPECCIEAFVAAGPDRPTSDLLLEARQRSVGFRWELNVLDPVSPFTLLPHLPCRFDCPASLDLASGILAALDGAFPFMAGAVRAALGRTWLWWDATRGVAVDGPADPDGLGCGCGHPDSPLQRAGIRPDPGATSFLARILPLLAASDRLRLDGSVVRGFRDGRAVGDVDEGGRPVLFPFGSR